jgi:hypothetical protein
VNCSCILALATLAATANWAGASPTRYDELTAADRAMISSLRAGHPRLLVLDEDVSRTRELIRTDAVAADWHSQLRKSADKAITQPTAEHKLSGPRLLNQSRAALQRILLFGYLWRLDHDDRYAARAEQELMAVCRFPDWNPSHFLDTAEMSNAVGIGFDWLYDRLTPAQRDEVTSALVHLGLEPGVRVYRSKGWWSVGKNNWNQVCNCGLTVGALAIAEREPDLAAFIVSRATASLKIAMAEFAPDGGWIEGPMYWGYTVRYCAFGFSAMESALGTVFGLDRAAGFDRTGSFPVAMTGPGGLCFDWGDCSPRSAPSPALFWLARRFQQPLYAWGEHTLVEGKPDVLDLVWLQPRAKGPHETSLPLDWHFRGIHVASMRSAWEDPNASFVALKGGLNQASHSNLDLGSFVFDADGVRWAMELGSEDYNLPGYWDRATRYGYYRLGTSGQNTLLLGGKNQETFAEAPITFFRGGRHSAAAITDLTAGYAKQASSVRRGFRLCGDRRHLLVQDEIRTTTPMKVRWSMHTAAKVETRGNAALLTSGRRKLRISALEPAGAVFEAVSARQEPPQQPNTGITRLQLSLPAKITSETIAVLLSPESAGEFAPTLSPLDHWPALQEGSKD